MRLIDISHVLDEDTPTYPGDPPTRLSWRRRIEVDHYNAFVLDTGLHTGTHVDVPMHLVDDARTAIDFPPDRFAGRGVLLDVRGERAIGMKPDYERRVRAGDVVLLYTGFDRHYARPGYFTDHPVVGGALASFLLSSGIKMLGVDMAAPDLPPYALHKDLLRRDILVLENLTHLERLLGVESFEVLALPLRIRAEASPVRAVCRVGGAEGGA